MRIIKSMEIVGLYRVTINMDSKDTIFVALWFETVSNSEFYKQIKKETENRLESLVGLPFNVLTIPYSEAKYHLREPKNI